MSKETVRIVTKALKLDFERERYQIKITICTPHEAKSLQTEEGAHKDAVEGEYSPLIQLQLTDGKCDIQYVIAGALGPKAELDDGEDVIEYNTDIGECTKTLYLSPTYATESNGIATIKYKIDGKHKHTVYINEIPIQRRGFSNNTTTNSCTSIDEGRSQKTPDLVQTSQASGTGETDLSSQKRLEADCSEGKEVHETTLKQRCGSSNLRAGNQQLETTTRSMQKLSVCTDAEKRIIAKSTNVQQAAAKTDRDDLAETVDKESSLRECVVNTEGGACEKEDEACPVPALQGNYGGSDVTPVHDDSDSDSDESDVEGDAEQADANSTEGASKEDEVEATSACEKIMADQSLFILSSHLDSGTARRLLVFLNVPSAAQDHHRANNHNDICGAIFESLRYWRNQRRTSGEQDIADNVTMYEKLLSQLSLANRNDIRRIIEKARSENRMLRKEDFE